MPIDPDIIDDPDKRPAFFNCGDCGRPTATWEDVPRIPRICIDCYERRYGETD